MSISKKEVEHIARLASLKIGEAEKEKFGVQLSQILAYIEKLNQLDTEKIEPVSSNSALKNIFRKDEVLTSLFPKNELESAPEKEAGHYKVPKII